MKVYLLDDLYEKAFNASYKARIDVSNIVDQHIENGEVFKFYRFIPPNFGQNNRLLRYLRLRFLFRSNQWNFSKLLKKVREGDIIVVPFSFEIAWFVLLTSFVFRKLEDLKKDKNVKIIYVVHDIISIRFPESEGQDTELAQLRIADAIIAHNPNMISWLISKGIEREKLINLQVFDYLSPTPKATPVFNDNSDLVEKRVIYAGNLTEWKSNFIYQWNPQYLVDLYGIGCVPEKLKEGVYYKGAFEPDAPSMDMNGISFGLVWDGDSIDGMEGAGKYLRYNNPHKVSLYLSQELPVIVWSESALASFVIENNIGFTIDKIDDINSIINSMSVKDYFIIKDNVQQIGRKLRDGGFMHMALKEAIEKVRNS